MLLSFNDPDSAKQSNASVVQIVPSNPMLHSKRLLRLGQIWKPLAYPWSVPRVSMWEGNGWNPSWIKFKKRGYISMPLVCTALVVAILLPFKGNYSRSTKNSNDPVGDGICGRRLEGPHARSESARAQRGTCIYESRLAMDGSARMDSWLRLVSFQYSQR
jgi:hypothetical protein